MATENDMTISQKKRKVKKKGRPQRKKATRVTKKKVTRRVQKKSRRKKPQTLKPIASNGVKKKRRVTRAQLEKQLQQAQQKIRKLAAQKRNIRSVAAKKGWETRRRKKAERASVALQEAETITGIVFSQIDKERLEFFQQPEVRKQIQDLFIEKIPEFFVEGPEWVEQRDPSIIRRLIYAEVEGTFDETAHEIAEETGYEPHEIYSLWWGYKLE